MISSASAAFVGSPNPGGNWRLVIAVPKLMLRFTVVSVWPPVVGVPPVHEITTSGASSVKPSPRNVACEGVPAEQVNVAARADAGASSAAPPKSTTTAAHHRPVQPGILGPQRCVRCAACEIRGERV
jgi:hypothetical protein